jgi:fructose-1,6-bisphosphatase/inositol monophosphatase family enzyme
MTLDLDRLASLIAEAARVELLPRFRALEAGDIMRKVAADGRDEVVTVADRAMERVLGRELEALLPGSIVVGEEAAAEDPSLLDALDHDKVWVVDPVDGTANFARGNEDFGVMVALVEHGVTSAAAIHLPLAGETLLAERNAGATLDGRSLRSGRGNSPRAGALHLGYAPPALLERARALESEAGVRLVSSGGSAAGEYANVATGRRDFVQYFRLLPWDHLPGVLIVREAGGASRLAEAGGARDYTAADREGLLISARDADTWLFLAERLAA